MSYAEHARRALSVFVARRAVMDRLDEGTVCPCCDKFCKRYKRKFNSAMAWGLIWLVKHSGATREWVHLPSSAPRFVISTNQMGTAAKWGLLESMEEDSENKKCSGYWRPTKLGEDFVYRRVSIPRFIYLYNNEPQDFSKERTTIREALGDRFDYEELMRGC